MSNSTNNVATFLLEGKDPCSVALRMIDRGHTYGELQSRSEAIARYLEASGTQKGDRVLLLGDNSLFWVISYLGILRAGLVCVPLPPNTASSGLAYILHATEARLVLAQARFAAAHKNLLPPSQVITDRDVLSLTCVAGADVTNAEKVCPHENKKIPDLPEVEPDDLAALMFTSGSTGKPRGVEISHRNIIANTESIVQYLNLTGSDRIMTVLPFHYCFGTSLLHTHLRIGASLVIDNRFMYPEKILERIIDAGCTGFAGVPSHFQILLRKSSLRKKQFPRLRYVQQAGGHLAPSFVRELREALPNTQIFVMYGQTEATARLSYVPPEHLDRKLGSIGKAIPGVTLRVLDDSGKDAEPGQIGEIVASGANVARGYWRDPEESAKCFRDDKLYTGDLGTLDDEGFIFVVDRAKDFLKCGGKRVSCRQLEEKLLEFDELLEAAVVGVKDEILGEAVKAFIVPHGSCADGLEARLLTFCKQHFPHQLVPKEIRLMNALPKNSAGKVLKQNLRLKEQRQEEHVLERV